MRVSNYIKVCIENADKLSKTNENNLYIFKKKIYPGNIYRIRGLVVLCTCYEVNEYYEPIMYFFMLLEGRTNIEISNKNITPTTLHLVSNIENEINYKKILKFYNSQLMKSYLS